ncbi:MAG TPA: VanZ family protein [Gemmatimonadaceae bacterium]|nr:VanZ family protein [Gemmatimonadaceae bacterium]
MTRRTIAAVALSMAVAAIAVATLRPAPPPTIPLPVLCLVCGELGGVDVVLNVALFVPLGIALVAAGMTWRRAALVAAALSFGIEAMQYALITGRDASLSDLLTNTTGGTLGALFAAHWRRVIAPAPRIARAVSLVAAAVTLGILAATAALLRPAIPPMGIWGQWTPQKLHFEPYSGTVRDFRINGIVVPYGLVPQSGTLRQRLLSGATRAHVEFTAGRPPSRLSAIARAGSRFQEVILVGADGRDLVFRTRLAARDWRLRAPGIALPNVLPREGEPVVAEAGLRDRRWYATVITAKGGVYRSVPFAVSLGWTFILPFDHALAPRDAWISALWLAVLAFPASYCGARGGTPRPRLRTPRDGFNAWWKAAMLVLALGLFTIPRLAHFSAAGPLEWLGLAVGGIAGALLAAPLDRLAEEKEPL